MGRTAQKAALVVFLFAACVAVQAAFYPASRLIALTVLDIVPVTLVALFWGFLPGFAAGLVATTSLILLEAFVDPGAIVNVAFLSVLFFAGGGALLGRMSDLTRADRRRAASLDEARARLASILESAKDAIITIDPDGRVTSWNAAAEQMFGWSEAEALGRDLHALIPGPRHHGGAGPQVPPFPRAEEARYLHTTVELEGCRRDGSVFPVELSLASFIQEGRRHAVGVVRDVSERRESEARYRRLFQNVPVGLYRTTIDGAILEVNQAMVELLKFPDRETLLARNALSLYVDPGVRGRIIRRAGREPAVHEEIQLLACDGSRRSCLVSLRAERGPHGDVTGFEGSLRDVTDMRRLEALHRQAGRLEAVEALAAGIAHDFSNILAGIRGFGELLARSTDASVGGPARRIVEAVDRADRISADLLAVMGGRAFRPRQVTIEGLCRSALDAWGPGPTGIVDFQPPPEPIDVVVDPEAIVSAIRELVENAVTASPDGSPVVVRAGVATTTGDGVLGPASERPGPWAWVSVTDRGTGMDETTRERIFEPYFTTKPFGTGSGLGLVRVLGLLRQHAGGIAVASAPGRGTTMTIYLPLAPLT